MPRRLFKRFAIKRHQLNSDNVLLRPFRKLLAEPRYWGIRRRTAVPAFSLGIFLAFQPLFGQPIIGTLIAIATRINIPIAFVTPFISNPLTMPPMFYASYRVGAWLLDMSPEPFAFEWSWEWLSSTFTGLWQPLLLGCIVTGTFAALLSFVVVDLMWRFSIWEYKRLKRRIRHGKRG